MRIKVTCFVEVPKNLPSSYSHIEQYIHDKISEIINDEWAFGDANYKNVTRTLSLTWEETKVPKK